MEPTRRAASLLLALSVGACGRGGLDRQLSKRIDASKAELVSVAYHDFQTGQRLELRANQPLHAASTMKLPVMMEVYRQADDSSGTFDLGLPLRVENRFSSIVDGSAYSLDPADDEDPWPYAQIGRNVPLGQLVERMIVRSSNLATNLIMAQVGAAEVTRLCRRLGADRIEVLRGVEDAKAHAAGRNNTTTARDLLVLLRAIAERRVPGADEMIEILARQELNEGIPAGLPPGTRVAHKTGSITAIYHDAALVLPPGGDRGYVLVILTRGIADEKAAADLVADLSRIVWNHRKSAR